MNATNLNIVLTNALCCSATQAVKVSKLYSIGNKCADEELAKLKLLNDRIEVLRCYNFSSTSTTTSIFESGALGEYTWGLWNSVLESPGVVGPDTSSLTITLNGVSYIVYGDDVTTCKNLIVAKLTELGVFINYTAIGSFNSYAIFELTCENITLSISIHEKPVQVYSFTNTQVGVCNIVYEPTNCLTEEQMNTMAQAVMKQCDICACQLTQ